MKFIKNILMVVGLLLHVGIDFAGSVGQAILNRIEQERSYPKSGQWEDSGPTLEDIMVATKVENQAAKESKEYKLISAVKNGDLKSVEALITEGAALEARDDQNMTPLMIAAKIGNTDIVNKLIKVGADIHAMNTFGWTALIHAIDSGHAEIVQLLLAHGAAKNQKDLKEWFISAVFNGKKDIVEALLAHEVDIDDYTLNTASSFARDAEIKERIKKSCS